MRKRALFIALAKRHKRGNFICGRRLAIVIGPPGTFVMLQGGKRERLFPSSRAVCRGDTHDALSKASAHPRNPEDVSRISTLFRETSLKSCKYAAPTRGCIYRESKSKTCTRQVSGISLRTFARGDNILSNRS